MSEWITGDKARAAGRKLRAVHDAIAVGANTAVIDNPQLTTRIGGLPDPIRIIFDSNLRLSSESELAKSAKNIPVWVFCKSDVGAKADILKALSIRLFPVPYTDTLNIEAALKVMLRGGVRRLLVEGGGTLAASFLRADVVDRIDWFRAPLILGGDGRSAVGDLGLTDLNMAGRFSRTSVTEMGDDLHEEYERII